MTERERKFEKGKKMSENLVIEEQQKVLQNKAKNMIVSASAGSGKTKVMIDYIIQLVCEEKVPVKNLVVLTFTKSAATEMKNKLKKRLLEQGNNAYVVEQLDNLSVSNISTIDSFCEKCVKKYANLLGISDNFEVADESLINDIKQNSFDNALKIFEEKHQEDFLWLVDLYKNNKAKIKTILFQIDAITDALADKESFLKKNIENPEKLFDDACEYILSDFKWKIDELIKQVEGLHLFDFENEVKNSVKSLVESENLIELFGKAKDFVKPSSVNKKLVGQEISQQTKNIVSTIKNLVDDILKLQLDDKAKIDFERNAVLEKVLLVLYELYCDEKEKLLKLNNCLSFGDIERYMSCLSKQANLFENFKYVFIDEYQDTNKIQENFVKNVAKNCNFVAFGDAKQGIYGFRQASCEIFMNDVEQFEIDENSNVRYLKSNFRSAKNVLDFVNSVCSICMTKQSCGIDYKKTSMLDGKKEFLDDGKKSIYIDLIVENEEVEEKNPDVYSVKNAKTFVEKKMQMQVLDIKRQIFEVMKSQIYDIEKKQFRDCRYSDIAILFRNRVGMFSDLENDLAQSGIPVISNSNDKIFDISETKILLNILKIALNFDDDVAMLSVLTSVFGGFSFEEIVKEKSGYDKTLCEIVFESEKFENFRNLIQKFKKNAVIFGIKHAFELLFDEIDYSGYVNNLINGTKIWRYVECFLNEISSSKFDDDIPSLIHHFENVDIQVTSEVSPSSDAVLLSTIHNSKGLEYPIVFLVECDKVWSSSGKKSDVFASEDFGFSVKYFDFESNIEMTTVKMKAMKIATMKKEFVDSLMLFYVALTRAKNRLYLFGEYNEKNFEKSSIFECNSYFDLIFYALKDEANLVLKSGKFENDSVLIEVLGNLQMADFGANQPLENVAVDEKLLQSMRDYFSYQYKYSDRMNFKLKETVTELNNKNAENVLSKYSNENFSFGSASAEIGNAYHLALKILDFEKISTIEDLSEQISVYKNALVGIELVDKELLLKNILTLKDLLHGYTIYKEKEFMMKNKICELVEDCDFDDEILVQGTVDLFAVEGEKIVLIDYKYSGGNEEYLKNKYSKQLKLYKQAIEQWTGKTVEKSFLLSLKTCKLIELDI